MKHGREIKKMAYEIMDILAMPRKSTPKPFMGYFIFSIKDKYFVPMNLWRTGHNSTIIGYYSPIHDYIIINENVLIFWDPDVAYAILFHELAHRKENYYLMEQACNGTPGGNASYNKWFHDSPDGDICHGEYLKQLFTKSRVPDSVIDTWYKENISHFVWNDNPFTNPHLHLHVIIEDLANELIDEQSMPIPEAWSRAITAYVPKRFCHACHFNVQTVNHKKGEPLVLPPPNECPACFRPIKQIVEELP